MSGVLLRQFDPLSVSAYTSKSSSSRRLVVLLCALGIPTAKIEDRISVISSDLAPIMDAVPEFRLYHALSTMEILKFQHHFLVMNAMTPLPDFEQMFNDWYITEHIPLLQRVPFWLSSERFVLVSASSANPVPSHLALHKWNDIAAFETDEYKAATNTPWRTEVMGKVIQKERLVLEYEGELEDLMVSIHKSLAWSNFSRSFKASSRSP